MVREFIARQKDSLSIDLLDQDTFLRYLNRPDLLREDALARLNAIAEGRRLSVLIDEVQKVPSLLDVVHSLFNSHEKRLQFLLTGSSARKLKRGGANMLAGRAWLKYLYPLTHREVPLDLGKALTIGTLPKVYLTPEGALPTLRAYVETYLKEEIQQEALVRRLDAFVRFLDLSAQLNGEPINFSKIARTARLSVPAVQDYFSILVDTMIVQRIDGWSHSIKKQLLQAPKYYWFDCGVLNAVRRETGSELLESSFRYGRLFETWVINECLRLNEYENRDFRFAYWRTSHGTEVDLILYRSASEPPIAVEIKSGRYPEDQELKGLHAFQKDNPSARLYCLCRAEQASVQNNVRVLPWQDGIREILS